MQYHHFGKGSRRDFLRAAAAFALTKPRFMPVGRRIFAYVGTYTSAQGPEGAVGRGRGIYLFEMNAATGALRQVDVFPSDSNPSWLALSPSRTYLYSANEISNYNGTNSGSVSAYSIDRATGRLTIINTVSSEGAGPAHLSTHPSGKYLFVANYHGGTIAVLPVRPNGELGGATDVIHDSGTLGSIRATSAPAGSFAISGHDKPHAHMIQADAAGKFVLASDLGLDQIFIWKFDVETGKLSSANPASVPLPSGDGPRHFAFHPNAKWFYSLQEEGSTLVAYDYDAENGNLRAKQTISTLPKDFKGTNFTAEVMISTDGRFVYAANRLHDTIAWFSIDHNGLLTFVAEEWTRGDYPRSFTIDPGGNYLYSCNQRADAITTYRINRKTGAVEFAEQYTAVGTPAMMVFLT